ncbi:MAG: hypothetical protein IT430_14955 [Phycisphaerales bacterium]|nr:hypothetical protein [Phycisphaerales bacterium]
MKIMFITTTALALATTPAIAGVCPEAFMSSLQRVMVEPAMDEAEGMIMTVAADWSNFTLKAADDQVVTIQIDKETVFTLDGKEVSRDLALASGRNAKVTHDEKTASRVEVTTQK